MSIINAADVRRRTADLQHGRVQEVIAALVKKVDIAMEQCETSAICSYPSDYLNMSMARRVEARFLEAGYCVCRRLDGWMVIILVSWGASSGDK